MVNMINALVVILIAVALLPVIVTQVTDANFSGTLGTIMVLVPLFLGIALLIKFAPTSKK